MNAREKGSTVPAREAYRAADGPFDEMFDHDGRPRPGCARIASDLLSRDPERLDELRGRAASMFLRMGVTFNVYSDDAGALKDDGVIS